MASPADLRRLTGADFTVSDQQWEAISAPLGPAVVIAGAGSGKTELMSARVIYLVANGLVRPDQVLGLTFTTKATAELSHRIRKALSVAGLDTGAVGEDGVPERLEPVVSTYNAYGAALLSEHGLRIGHEQDLRVMADASRFQLAQRVIAQHRGVVARLSDHPPTVIGYLLALDGAMSEHLVGVEDVRDFHRRERPRFEAALARLVAEGGTKGRQDCLRKVLDKMDERDELLGLVADYRALKAELGLLDFSDQIAGAHRLATGHPEVGEAEREKYRVVLLDEYQDTSVAQARLLAGLFGGDHPDSGRGHPVMAVGDPNQAIYGWRGASVANIEQFREQFLQADGSPARLFHLTVNRRSDRRILELANTLAGPLYAASGALVAPLEAKPGAAEGRVRTCLHRTHDEELAWLAREVQAAHDAGTEWREIGVLVRTNKHGAEVYDALTEAEIPVEIVGLGGLIRLPEVAQVVATLSLLDDLTDNAALLTLLTGPRWEIGPRDLALLGERSAALARVQHRDDPERSLADEMHEAVAGADPTEIASLNEALEDPGDLDYSPEARERFARLAAELRHLRGYVGEPLLDLLRRIMDVTGLDIELASSTSPAAEARRENLDLFVKAVADFQAVDGSVTLSALNAWLETEDDYGGGLDVAPPSESDAVKLLTIHRAKGLEYDTVFLAGVADKKFPNTTLRSQWTTVASVLPSPLRGDKDHVPQAPGCEPEHLRKEFVGKDDPDHSLESAARDHQALEELRLGYVAFTRARHEFVVSSHTWGTTIKPLDPSPYLLIARDLVAEWGEKPEVWEVAEQGEANPVTSAAAEVSWPVTGRSLERARREAAAALVKDQGTGTTPDPAGLTTEERKVVQRWDAEIERLLAEASRTAATVREVPLPAALSATAVARLREDPDGFARDLARPMPRPPAPQARFGTRFHAWVEARFGQQQLLDPDELPGRADAGIEDEAELLALQGAFEAGEFGDRSPHAVEAPFSLVLGGQVVRGRIDAVYAEHDGGFLVVDWKTNRRQTADPLQLALYRLAWSELQGVPLEKVRAAFHYVRSGETVEPPDLPGRQELEALVSGG
ncbi:DNA helicase UvrD [Nocardioides gansuensis]|uniref:DNA 3'-5' helicase n=1 Tax=Nocardioides gansuensis TaxID=2138300 RepID=A0A2T8FCR7_9ACTN|nr:DNA helicase UvrD [Nocardioides gansuensis]